MKERKGCIAVCAGALSVAREGKCRQDGEGQSTLKPTPLSLAQGSQQNICKWQSKSEVVTL